MSVLGSLRAAREWAYPKLTKSAFLEKGVLTPEEFVQAGDELVYRCPTWAWESGEPSKQKSYLPPDKQYLITRNVPCQARVSSMETALSMQAEAFGGEDNDGNGDNEEDDWLVSSIIKASDNPEDEFDILDEDGEVIPKEEPSAAVAGSAAAGNNTTNNKDSQAAATSNNNNDKNKSDDADDEYEDMDAFQDDDVLMDTDAAEPTNAANAATATTATTTSTSDNDNLIKVRTYDLSITYDKYYQTPRVWMIGRNANDQPLTAAEMMEDVISDYANKTVTMEHHPLVSGQHASIHPCQHGKVMKAIVKNLIRTSGTTSTSNTEAGEGAAAASTTTTDQESTATATGPTVEMYLFIFLKFVSSMIPTINYDFTMDVTADTSK